MLELTYLRFRISPPSSDIDSIIETVVFYDFAFDVWFRL